MGVPNIVRKVADKAGNSVAKLSALSTEQILEVMLKREKYLLEMPKPDDDLAIERTWRMMAASSIEIFNSYLPQIKELYLPLNKDEIYSNSNKIEHNIRYFNITKWVTDKKENNLEKLVNVYAVLSDENCNIALVFNRTQNKTNVYLAVVNNNDADNNVDINMYSSRLIEAIRGNFPGAEWNSNEKKGQGIIPCLDNDKPYSVAAASNIPTEKSEKFISQTIEKLLDGVIPDSLAKEYTIVLLATPINDVEQRKAKLSEFYSGMKPYAEWETQYTYNENNAVGSSATMGINVGASAGVQNGNNLSTTSGDSTTDSESITDTESKSDSLSTSDSTSLNESEAIMEGSSSSEAKQTGSNDTRAVNNSLSTSFNQSTTVGDNTYKSATGGVNAGLNFGDVFSIGANGSTTGGSGHSTATAVGRGLAVQSGTSSSHSVINSLTTQIGQTASKTISQGVTNTLSNTVGKTVGSSVANTLGKAVTKSMAITGGISHAVNFGANVGANFARSSSVTTTIGKGESITQHFSNFGVKHAMELLENQMKRFEQSSALGMWDFAAYVLSEDPNVANNVAHTYLALTLGEESYMSKSAVNLWKGNVSDIKDKEGTVISSEKTIAKEIVSYIRELRHPIFGLNGALIPMDRAFNVYPSIVTATTALSGKELAYSLNFPQKSIAGLPVLECAEFGRNIVSYDSTDDTEKKLVIGKIFHMNHVEDNKVALNKNSLASHTFITGSTGSGKSNTVYKILDKAKKEDVKFLVIEPAKGEYKNVFGKCKDVTVYGTNPRLSKILRINPFSFPEDIHILEHLDRLVEIFNVCWPMYAAMPAVLKDAVEKSYKDCGWDLLRSINKYGEKLYPTFADVAGNIRTIIDSSEYDNENKGAYKGSLLTRLRALTTGLNRMLFTSDEISSHELFDNNVIVDLSRVGSSETKSLIMGMLILKLQEYRMTSQKMNSELTHLTVLEEAHNLLKRTSTEQSSESSNLLGKSVEMLANAIAEMRTYGEGFIIADQAPALLDMSVIRNTNTKIIMRLPDFSDRELVGRAANLNDDQINELAKLPCGVAAIYQNEWVQPVLCKVDKHEKINGHNKPDDHNETDEMFDYDWQDDLEETLLDSIINKELYSDLRKKDIIKLKHAVVVSKLDSSVKRDFLEYISSDDENTFTSLRQLIFDFMSAEEAIKSAEHCTDVEKWIHTMVKALQPSIQNYSKQQIDLVIALILCEKSERDAEYTDLYCRFTEIYEQKGGVY